MLADKKLNTKESSKDSENPVTWAGSSAGMNA